MAQILEAAGGGTRPHKTQSGLELKRVYTPADVAQLDFAEDLGYPGQYPFTRSVHPTASGRLRRSCSRARRAERTARELEA